LLNYKLAYTFKIATVTMDKLFGLLTLHVENKKLEIPLASGLWICGHVRKCELWNSHLKVIEIKLKSNSHLRLQLVFWENKKEFYE
jgi:hypothetical protein